ncbi:MAG: hypothetical protein PHQ22_08390 [Sulfuricurvum sp.]|nr:hypothetical protein [Sulfuricurvum sp.]MDD5387195.1 hypothetical protein [Sulfuricurvum sp.]
MSKNNIREALLAQFIDPPKVNSYASSRILPATRKGKTLADFYTEVFKSSKPLYETKSAKELEIMMMQNRKLIEAKNKRH